VLGNYPPDRPCRPDRPGRHTRIATQLCEVCLDSHARRRTHAHTRELGGCGWLGGCLVYCCRVCHSATHLLRHKSTLQSASRAIQNPIAPRRHPRLLLAAFVERLLIENPVPAPGDENECNVRNGSKHRGKLKDDSDDVCIFTYSLSIARSRYSVSTQSADV
jgi:hypothetical protein